MVVESGRGYDEGDVIGVKVAGLTADCSEDLEGHVSDVLHCKGQEVVLPQVVEGAEAQQLKHNADVPVMVEPVQHSHTRTERERERERERKRAQSGCIQRPGIT